MRLAIKSLAVALLALVAATPTSANAGKKETDPTAFRIDIQASWTETEVKGSFRASGAIADSGPAYPGGVYDHSLVGKNGSFYVFITPLADDALAGTFKIWDGDGTSFPGELLGTGTATGSITGSKRIHVKWRLDGNLNG